MACTQQPMKKTKVNNKIVELIFIGFALQDSGYIDSSIVLFQELLPKITDQNTLAVCHNSLGSCYNSKHQYPKALEHFLLAANYFEQISDSISLARTQINISKCFKTQGVYDEAIEYALQAEQILHKTKFQKELATIYNLIANSHKALNNFHFALSYYNKVITSHPSFLPVYNNIGNLFFDQHKHDSALIFYNQYYRLALQKNDDKRIAFALENKAKTALALNDITKVILFLDSANLIYQSLNNLNGTQSIHQQYSNLFLKTKNITASEKAAIKALRQSQSLNLPHKQIEALKNLSLISAEKGNYKQALQYNKTYVNLKDSIEGIDKIRKAYALELASITKRNRDKLQKVENKRALSESQRKQRKAERNIFIVLGISLSFLTFNLLKRYKKKKRFVENYFSSTKEIILKSGIMVQFDDILKIETLRNDLKIILTNKEVITEKNTTLKSFIPILPKIQFGRPQRGIVLNLNRVSKVLKNKLYLLNESINISNTYKDEFMKSWDSFKQVKESKS